MISGRGTSLELTKRPFIAFKGTLLSQSMKSSTRLCEWRPELGFYTPWFDKALTHHHAECCWPSKQSLSLKLHRYYRIPSCYILEFEKSCSLTHRPYYKSDTVESLVSD